MDNHCGKNEMASSSNDADLVNTNEDNQISTINDKSLNSNGLIKSSMTSSNELPIQNTPNDDQLNKDTNKKIQKRVFTVIEDNMLLSLVKTYGEKNWALISKLMKQYNFNRNVRQCKDRYFHYLDPKISSYSDWTAEEDDILLKYVAKFGKKWKLCEKIFTGRTEVSIRNRYQVLIRKYTRDQKLLVKNQITMKKKQSDFYDNIFKNYLKMRDQNMINIKFPNKNIENVSFDSQIEYDTSQKKNASSSNEKKNNDFDLFSISEEEFDNAFPFDEMMVDIL